MKKIAHLPRNLLMAVLLAGLSPVALAGTGYEVSGSSTFASDIKLQMPIDVNLDVNGVKLGSVFFDTDKVHAFVILQNRTPIAVSPKVGVSLFDAAGKLLATGVDVTPFSFSGDNVGPGKQKNVELDFSKFINSYENVGSFQVVFSIGKTKEAPSQGNNAPF